MIPLVLGRIADAINEKDVNQMDELMTPYLAKLYKQGVGSLNTHGLRMHLEINVQGSNTKDDFERLKLGNPEAYDYTIPYNVRDARYSVWKLANTIVALKKTRDGEIMTGGIKDGFGGNLFSQWLALEFGFVVNANIKIGLYKDNQLIDSDSGMMQIPIAISSPHYLGMQALIDAVAAGKQAEEPFRWRVCDLFYAAALNNANEVFMANKENNS
ncbi:hypothetical protein EV178_005357 [Coemansia sp. RSA 1646]|nr:hypothetical protein EV178_005357 [Coemansia sp. RSA 1646]